MMSYFAGNALEDLNLDDPLNLAASIDKDLETDSPTVSNSISAGLASSGKYSLSNIRKELIYINLDLDFCGFPQPLQANSRMVPKIITLTCNMPHHFTLCNESDCRSQWPRDLRCGSAAARLLGSWV